MSLGHGANDIERTSRTPNSSFSLSASWTLEQFSFSVDSSWLLSCASTSDLRQMSLPWTWAGPFKSVRPINLFLLSTAVGIWLTAPPLLAPSYMGIQARGWLRLGSGLWWKEPGSPKSVHWRKAFCGRERNSPDWILQMSIINSVLKIFRYFRIFWHWSID